jgi:hypothetical protein
MEADDREHLTGRRNRPLNELPTRLQKGAEEFRPFDKLRAAPSKVEGRERQRRAGAQRHAKKVTTCDRGSHADGLRRPETIGFANVTIRGTAGDHDHLGRCPIQFTGE